jgi:hypothetical protein
MLVKTSPVTVLHKGPYSTENDPDPLMWGDRYGDAAGSYIEKVMVLDGTTVYDNITVDPTCKVKLKAGDLVSLTIEIQREAKAAFSRSQREYVAVKDKWRLIDAEPATAAQAHAA